MDLSNSNTNKIQIPVLKIPCISASLHIQHIYKLGDSAYGEWLIYENGIPTFYLNIFDPIYDENRESILKMTNVEEYLTNYFQANKLAYQLTVKNCVQVPSKIEHTSLWLEKLPSSFLKV